MTKETSKELHTLLDIFKENLEVKARDDNLTEDQVTCLLIVADAIGETIKEYLE